MNRFFCSFALILYWIASLSDARVWAEKPPATGIFRTAVDATLATILTSDFRSTIHDKPLRDALESIAKVSKANFFLDRQTDPTKLITIGADTRTVFQAVTAVAQSAGLQAIAVDNFVLVGRSEWLEKSVGSILATKRTGTSAEIAWPELTTPTQAALACGANNYAALPHDLWPAVQWTNANQETAHRLVAAQFDLMPPLNTRPNSKTPIEYQPLAAPTAKISALYPRGVHAAAMRSAIAKVDPRATIKEIDSYLLVAGSAAAQVAAINSWLGHAAKDPSKTIDIDKVRFSLELKNAVAEQVLRQFATTAGRKLIINPAANELCKQPVSLSAKDKTLRELVESIAAPAGLAITWTDVELQVNVRQ